MKKIIIVIAILLLTSTGVSAQYYAHHGDYRKEVQELEERVHSKQESKWFRSYKVTYDTLYRDSTSMMWQSVYDSVKVKESFDVSYIIAVKKDGDLIMIAASKVTVTYWNVYRNNDDSPDHDPVSWQADGIDAGIANFLFTIIQVKPMYGDLIVLHPSLTTIKGAKTLSRVFY